MEILNGRQLSKDIKAEIAEEQETAQQEMPVDEEPQEIKEASEENSEETPKKETKKLKKLATAYKNVINTEPENIVDIFNIKSYESVGLS